MNNNENLIALECLECQLLLSKCKRRHQQSLACKYTRVCVHTHTHECVRAHTHTRSFSFQSSNPSSYRNSHGGEREEKDDTRKDVPYDLVVPLT